MARPKRCPHGWDCYPSYRGRELRPVVTSPSCNSTKPSISSCGHRQGDGLWATSHTHIHPVAYSSLPFPIPLLLASTNAENKYIDLGKLLPAGLLHAFKQMREGQTEDTAKRPKKIPITLIVWWAAAFTTYAMVLARSKPGKSRELLTYMGICFAWDVSTATRHGRDTMKCSTNPLQLTLT